MKNPVHALDPEARRRQQFGQLCGVEFAGVERVDRGIAAGGEGDPVRCRHQQRTGRSQDAKALGHELPLIPEMFDHLEVDHDINVTVGQWQLGQVAVPHLHPRIPGPHMCHGRLVVVQPDHTARLVGNQVGAVALAAARLEHIAPGAAGGQPSVHHLVAAEPVVLLRQAGNSSLAGKRQIRTVGNECAHCKAG